MSVLKWLKGRNTRPILVLIGLQMMWAFGVFSSSNTSSQVIICLIYMANGFFSFGLREFLFNHIVLSAFIPLLLLLSFLGVHLVEVYQFFILQNQTSEKLLSHIGISLNSSLVLLFIMMFYFLAFGFFGFALRFLGRNWL